MTIMLKDLSDERNRRETTATVAACSHRITTLPGINPATSCRSTRIVQTASDGMGCVS